jgi:hypothetical protein
MEKKLIDLTQRIFYLSVEVSNKTDWKTTFSYNSGMYLTFYLYKEGWRYDDYIEAEIAMPCAEYPFKKGIRTIESAIDRSRNVVYQLTRILKGNELNHDKLNRVERVEYDIVF